ncbi:hypothetical protein MAPG_05738 [Magnaporthiopsis poae ATCC 64411]|uniref:Uncharacterized protein n=1 Tax=Magnaporthiopsis poae (strain ATCC 64411 / 73-15) TaxID=644358 RepID=A0A0C4E070_MAGP6|nr:hypothetical protein MAPG_05738 [Magnaporthiopsis poae ATCC 64411]
MTPHAKQQNAADLHGPGKFSSGDAGQQPASADTADAPRPLIQSITGIGHRWRKGVGQAVAVEVAAVALRAELDAAAAARFQQEQAV